MSRYKTVLKSYIYMKLETKIISTIHALAILSQIEIENRNIQDNKLRTFMLDNIVTLFTLNQTMIYILQ